MDDFKINYDNNPEFPENLTPRREEAIDLIYTVKELLNGGEKASDKLFELSARLGCFTFPVSYETRDLRNFILGYANDHIITSGYNSLEKCINLIYYFENIQHPNDAFEEQFYLQLKNKVGLQIDVLQQWFLAQNDKTPVQITDVDSITMQMIEDAFGIIAAIKYHLFDLNRTSSTGLEQTPRHVEFEGHTYDFNYAPDIIVRVADIYGYYQWQNKRVEIIDIFLDRILPVLNYEQNRQRWWSEHQEIEHKFKSLDSIAAFRLKRIVQYLIDVDYKKNQLDILRNNPEPFKAALLKALDHRVIKGTSFFNGESMLYEIFKIRHPEIIEQGKFEEILSNLKEIIQKANSNL